MNRQNEPPVIAIIGPTAVGKSRVAVLLAERFDGEIICADSRQIYTKMDIGTDKVPFGEQKGITHHLQDTVAPSTPVSAGVFVRMAEEALLSIRRRFRVPFLVGGSGLYIEAFLTGLFEGPTGSESIRQRLKRSLDRRGKTWLHRVLLRLDPETAQRLSVRDVQRVTRAIEVRLLTGEPISRHHSRDETRKRERRRPHIRIGLHMERDRLFQRINRRVDEMFKRGLVREVTDLLEEGLNPEGHALSAIGYAEVISSLRSELPGGVEDVRDLVKRNTRRLAKRQMTWFHHHGEVEWFERKSDRETAQDIEAYLSPLLQ